MTYAIRPARHEDVGSITPWTSDTFSWGDYVPERLPRWLEDEASEVLVSVDDDDVPVALAHVVMLSPIEAWIEGARVHPDHRRLGLGKALNDAGVNWAANRGGRVIRLATEADNIAARAQVQGLGYRNICNWVYASIPVDPTHRTIDQFRLRPAPGSDADAAWLFWAASDLARVGRELMALGWQWRTARPNDVTGMGELLQSAAGWVSIAQPRQETIVAHWMATTPEDMLPLLDGLRDAAAERGATEIDLKLPELGWSGEGIRRAGGDPARIHVYAKPI